MTRLRLGHSHLTHSFLLKREDPPFCVGCHQHITIKHVLLDCIEFSDVRPRFYNVNGLNELFGQVPPDVILSFLKEIGLYMKI